MVYVDLRTFGLFFLLEEVVNTFRGNRCLADRGGQQVRTNNVAGNKVSFTTGNLVEGIGVDQAATVVE